MSDKSRQSDNPDDAHSGSRDQRTNCLNPDELSTYEMTGELPVGRLDHVESCSHCGELLAKVISPPDIRSFLLNLESEDRTSASPADSSRRHVVSNLVTITLPLVALLSVAFSMAIISLMNQVDDLRQEFQSDNQVKLSNKEGNSRDSAEPQRNNPDVNLTNSEKKDTSSPPSQKGKPVQQWTRGEIIDWMLSGRGHLDDEVNFLFRKAASEGIREAIPKAVLWGSNPPSSGRKNASGARDFLNNYTDQEIIDGIREFGPSLNHPLDSILERFAKAKDMIRRN